MILLDDVNNTFLVNYNCNIMGFNCNVFVKSATCQICSMSTYIFDECLVILLAKFIIHWIFSLTWHSTSCDVVFSLGMPTSQTSIEYIINLRLSFFLCLSQSNSLSDHIACRFGVKDLLSLVNSPGPRVSVDVNAPLSQEPLQLETFLVQMCFIVANRTHWGERTKGMGGIYLDDKFVILQCNNFSF